MRAVVVVVMLCSAVVGCGPDLGNCDLPAAQTIVYLNGTPFVEGQALIHQSCAGSFCHAAGATGAARLGAPHGLDFDVAPMTANTTAEDFVVLQRGINRIRDEAEELWSVIDSGEMPPLPVGERPDLPWYRDAEATMPAMLTGLDLAEARDRVRNWLACAAPVVAATTDSPLAPQVQALNLGRIEMPGRNPVGPTLPSIHENLLKTCVTCHGPTSPYDVYKALDFTSVDTSYAALVNKDAFTGPATQCGGTGRKLVIPGDCENSLLYQKLLPNPPCGASMPLGGTPPSEEVRKAVCDWINAGAMR